MSPALPAAYAVPFAELALANVVREYPNAPAHLYAGPEELVAPRTLHPAFYGGYDWHSTVHMHWLLVRIVRRFSTTGDLPATLTTRIREVLDSHLTPENIAVEASYLRGRPHFERPYGWAWLIALAGECRTLGTPDGDRWADALASGVAAVGDLLGGWLPKATYPVRHGVHNNSAFGLGLILDAGPAAGLAGGGPGRGGGPAADLVHGRPRRARPLGALRPGLPLPALAEADAMRRVLPVAEFRTWIAGFLPDLVSATPDSTLLEPPVVSDHADPQIGHLLGLTLSRAAALRSIAGALPDGPGRTALLASAEAHLARGLPTVSSGDFSSDHWLATYAALALDTAPGH